MRFLGWLKGPRRDEINHEREETRRTKGQLATKLVELENARYRLDDMVRKSLTLMEGRNK